ncbi:GNAT family N-acetyltransferase [Vallitalea okinawensis]|uniref:GNAT family N-acetyltransferase n=1 Tax=Vallitalea okinawensis TaxID=2078660 RepID=UPI000CFAFA34|nr:GNAT family N-acetyltransferase [Vallitalea okinawensis]
MYRNIRIETERLIIKSFTKEDLHHLHRIVNDVEMMKYVPFAKERTLPECKKLLDRILKRYTESTSNEFKGFLLLVYLNYSNECIGFVGLFPLTYDTINTEIFYGLFEEYYGKGYATEIGKAIIQFTFDQMNLDKIVATVNKDNEVSKRVLSKIGMNFDYIIDKEVTEGSSYDGELMYSISKYI